MVHAVKCMCPHCHVGGSCMACAKFACTRVWHDHRPVFIDQERDVLAVSQSPMPEAMAERKEERVREQSSTAVSQLDTLDTVYPARTALLVPATFPSS